MQSRVVLKRSHPDRQRAEQFIASIFQARYGAEIVTFPSNLIVRLGTEGQILCAAGLRFPTDGFFSEQYLSEPIEDALCRITRSSIDRRQVFEVTSLASRDARQTAPFIRDIITFGQSRGQSWAFFTLTSRFSQMLARIGISSTYIARADQTRIADHGRWGSYYDHDPCVFAYANPDISHRAHANEETSNAISF